MGVARTSRIAACAAACLALCACRHGASLAEIVSERTREQLRADFRQQVETFVSNQQPGGAPDAPGLAKSAAGLLWAYGIGHDFSGKPGDLVLWLTPSLDTGLNRLALVLRDSVKGRVAYDVGYLLENPNAPARFDPATNVLALPHAAVADLHADEPSVLRELVHVRTWATLRSGWPTPYGGYLRGGPFAADLFLDEMNADAEEVRYAAHELSALLGKELDPASPVARADLSGILRARLSGQQMDAPESRVERIWDRLVSRILLGGWHAYPALEALGPLARAAADPSRVQYEATPDGARALVRAQVPFAGSPPQEVLGLFYLPSSQGPSDPKNPQILARQAASALLAARERARQFTRARTAALAVAGEVSPERKLKILLDPKALSGDL